MDLLTQFKSLLLEQKNIPSNNTVKNYLSDIRGFITWFENTHGRSMTPSDFSQSSVDSFLTQSDLSPRTRDRQIAAVRKMTSLLHTAGVLNSNPFSTIVKTADQDTWRLRDFKHELFKQKASPATVKNYLSDLTHFTKWVETEYGIQKHLNITEAVINTYKDTLIHVLNLSPKSVNRKLSTLRKYTEFGQKTGLILQNAEPIAQPTAPIANTVIHARTSGTRNLSALEEFRIREFTYSKFPPVRILQRLGLVYGNLEEYAAFHASRFLPSKPEITLPDTKSFWNKIRHSRPAWYHRYHALPISSHIHIAVLSVYSAFILIFGYARYFDIPQSGEVLGITQQNRRVLVYSGKLATKTNMPITKPTEIIFSIYPDPTANDSVLWKETHQINPNHDGSFTVQLGRKQTLTDSFFAEKQNLYLSMKIGGESELLPRQRLANVGYAADSHMLDGMEPITKHPEDSANSILALDSSGNLIIGGTANPLFQATGGDFTISGTTTILTTTPGSNGNVVLTPDGSGVIDIRKPIVNDSQDASASGSVDFADEVSIATESAGSVLSVHNTSDTGSILSLMSRNVTRMTVDNSGNVGIGTTAPSQLVHLAHTSAPTMRIENLVSGTLLDISALETLASIGTNNNSSLGFKTNSLVRMSISPTGNVGIGTSTPTALLDVNGTASIAGSLTFTGGVRNIQSSNNNNLIIGGNTTGNLIFQPLNGSGFVGISTNSPEYKLDLLDSQASRAAMQIFNSNSSTDADGLNIRLGNQGSNVSKDNKFISFQTQGMGTIGSISGNGSSIAYNTNNADFAEYIKKDPTESIPYGSIACLTEFGTVSVCSRQHTQIIGVTSESPGFVGGKNLGNASIEVGLVGQIQTFVSGENGSIKAGDPITLSQIPGVGVKATEGGMIVGRALEDYSSSSPGKILVLVQPSWHDPTISLSAAGELKTTSVPLVELDTRVYEKVAAALTASTFSVSRENEIVKSLVSFSSATIGSIKTGVIEAQNGVFSGTIAARRIVVNQLDVMSDNISVNGVPLSQYIASILPEDQARKADASGMKTNFISPVSDESDISLSLENSKLEIRNSDSATGSAVASIDNEGNASFSGTLSARNGEFEDVTVEQLSSTGDASIAGTLTADTIKAKSIDGLEETVSNIASKYIKDNQILTPTPSAAQPDLQNTEIESVVSLPNEFIDISTMSAQFALFHENLLSLGTTTLREATVMDSFSIGTQFVFGQDSLNVLGSDLHIQPLRQGGVSFLGGLVALDKDGNLTVGGNAHFAKNVTVGGALFANILSPLPGVDFDIFLPDKNSTESSQFRIINGSKMPVLTVNSDGDVYSSGSAKFVGDLVASGSAFLSKLNIFSQDAQAVSGNEMVASSSAGTAYLNAYEREVTIRSPYVNGHSLIYITPGTDTGNQVLYLRRQSDNGSFTVGVNEALPKDVHFNWIVVN